MTYDSINLSMTIVSKKEDGTVHYRASNAEVAGQTTARHPRPAGHHVASIDRRNPFTADAAVTKPSPFDFPGCATLGAASLCLAHPRAGRTALELSPGDPHARTA